MAIAVNCSISSLYYQSTREAADLELKLQIEAVMVENPTYGYRRVARTLKLGKNKVGRVMKRYGLKPAKRRFKKFIKKGDLNKADTGISNIAETMCPIRPYMLWASDFTYIRYREKFIYLATVLDVFSREITGYNVARTHAQELILGAIEDALGKHPVPQILHSDQGSEYDSTAYMNICKSLGIQVSMSAKGSPWQNGYQESFYSYFKLELGDASRFQDYGELVAEIYRIIGYYNNFRLHSQLEHPPTKTREFFFQNLGA